MNTKLIYVFLLFAIISSCKNNELFTLPSDIEDSSPINAMIKNLYHRNFMTDFICQSDITVEKVPSKDFYHLTHPAGAKDIEALKTSYPKAKKELSILSQENNSSKYHIIQSAGLRYLRNLHLPSTNEENLAETLFLFRAIMKTNPIDLDVLTDAYIKIEHLLEREEKETYFSQLQLIYNKHQKTINNEFHITKENYLNAESERKKKAFLIKGKYLERLSLSCNYSNKKLKFSRLD